MALRVILFFFAAVPTLCANAAEYHLGSSYYEPLRTRFCPVHAPFDVSQEGSTWKLEPPRRGAYSLVEADISLPAGNATIGLRLRLSAQGSTLPTFWRFAIRSGDTWRFIAPVEVPSGGTQRTVFIPWTAFRGQKVRTGGVDHCDHNTNQECIFKPSEMIKMSVIWSRKNGVEEPSLMLHEVVATSSSEVPLQNLTDAACSCDTDCVYCMTRKWMPLVSKACASSTTSDMCLAARRSLAERIAAGLGGGEQISCGLAGAQEAVQWLASTIDVTNCITGSPILPATVLGDVLSSVLNVALHGSYSTCDGSSGASTNSAGVSDDGDGFAGPNVGWGITGHNDLSHFASETADSCLEKCRAEPRCKSFDYGARDSAQGECWLSTADRISAANSYSDKWKMYDYYEKASLSTDADAVNAGFMASALSSQRRSELLQGLMQINDCCADAKSCIVEGINRGAPTYNKGDALGCFVIYHATATRLAECTSSFSNLLPDARGLMHATARTSERDPTPSHAAWRLRRAFDAYLVMVHYSDPQSLQCKQRTPYRITGVTSISSREAPFTEGEGQVSTSTTMYMPQAPWVGGKSGLGKSGLVTTANIAGPSLGGSWQTLVCLLLGMQAALAGLN